MTAKQGSTQQNVAVIGAGVIGITSALKLQQLGFNVTIFDPQGAAQGCSKGNAGHLATEQVFPLASPSTIKQIPSMLFASQSPLSIRWRDVLSTLPWMIRFLYSARKRSFDTSTRALTELNQHSLPSWETLLSSIDEEGLIKVDGSLLVFESEALFESYQETLDALNQAGVEYQIWDQLRLRRKLPKLGLQVRYGVFFPNTGHTIEPYELCVSLNQRFQELGGKFVENGVLSLTKQGEVITENGTQQFDRIVLAAGLHSAPLVASLTGIKVPIQAERGYHVMVEKFDHELPMAVSSADRKFIMTPMKHGLRLAGTVEYGSPSAPFNRKRTELLIKQGDIMLQDGIDRRAVGDHWMGERPSTSDSLPVIDTICDDKIVLAFGHQHLGLTQAAITADLVSQLITNQPTSINVAPFTLRRFS